MFRKSWFLMVVMGFFGACGGNYIEPGIKSDVRIAPSTYSDMDGDGLPDPVAFKLLHWWEDPTSALQPNEDWCPYYGEREGATKENHGCAVATTGKPCDVPGKFSEETWIDHFDTAYGYPFGSWCVPNVKDAFRRAGQDSVLTSGTAYDYPGTWRELHEDDDFDRPFAIEVSSCVPVAGGQVIWRLKNGTAGMLDASQCDDPEWSCPRPRPPTHHGSCWFTLPVDGTIAYLGTSDPELKLTAYIPMIDSTIKRAPLKANGENIPAGFLAMKNCSQGCNF